MTSGSAPSENLELYLLRHADAGDPAAWDRPDDERPLSRKGNRQAERMGAFLAGIGFEVDAILTSPKVRARETAEIVAAALHQRVTTDDRLADGPAVDVATVRSIVADLPDARRIMLVGHDPEFSDLVETLTGAAAPLRKGALARLDVITALAPGGALLRWLIQPELLRGDR